ncbi:endonuclease/exonuclease/phosphatase family protein [Salegentibacter sp. Hel_I_6]|uniref:endonuclease/exonuclease/phosphatase family protein n=1 Tax=Salegentibacter sp. Hel_I_6 TaxID=1250278 RepID=UPI00055DEFC0|nr:endonuclease/exonuclease/phosphatase family protein [Salegentibacter sp. Hel_I_6]
MEIGVFKKLTWLFIFGILSVSILPNIFFDFWFVDIFANFKLQYLVISVLLLVVAIILLQKKILAIILLSLAICWNSYYIVPYYLKSDPLPKTSENQLRISSINLLSSNSKVDLVLDYIQSEDPEVLILMEFTPEWQNQLLPVIQKYKYKELAPRRDNFGIALLSKHRMKSSIDYFELNNKPSIVADLHVENEKLSLIATHPIPLISQTTFDKRNKQLVKIINKRSQYAHNLIIAGDFNISSFSNHFKILLRNGLKDSRLGFGLLPTWPANYSILQTTLDHFLVSDHIPVIDRSTGPYIGSDHLPINMIIGIN